MASQKWIDTLSMRYEQQLSLLKQTFYVEHYYFEQNNWTFGRVKQDLN
jgi:hypothetical protein